MRRFGILISLLVIITGGYIKAQDIPGEGDVFPGNDSLSIFEMSLEQLQNVRVVSSSLVEIKKFQEAGKSYVYEWNELNLLGIYSNEEVIDLVMPGMNIAYHARTSDLIGVRGMQIDVNSKTMSLRNSVNMNARVHYGIIGADLTSPLNGDVNRMELMLSPGALQHGSGAINGYYNLITHTGKTSPGVKANVSYGSGNTKITELSYGLKKKEMNFYIYGGYHQSDGVEFDPALPLTYYPGVPSDTIMSIAKVGYTQPNYKLSSRFQLGNKDQLMKLDMRVYYAHLTLAPISFNNKVTYGTWEEEMTSTIQKANVSPFLSFNYDVLSVTPELKMQFNRNNKLKISPVVQVIATGLRPTKIMNDAMDEFGLEGDERKYKGGIGEEYNYNAKATFLNSSIDRVKIAAGVQAGWRDFVRTAKFLYDTTKKYGVETKTTDMSAFTEVLVDFSPITISGGLRYDYWDITDAKLNDEDPAVNIDLKDNDILTGKIHVGYMINKTQNIKFVYQQGYRFPEAQFFTDNYKSFHDWNLAKEELHIGPESMQNFDLNYEIGIGENLLLSTNGAYNIYNNTLSWGTDAGGFINAKQNLKSFASETSIMYKLPTIKMNLSYSYSQPINSHEKDVQVANENNTWTRFPSHMIKFNALHKQEKLTVGLVMKLRSGAYKKWIKNDGTPLVLEEYQKLVEGWAFETGLHASYQIIEYVQIYTKTSHFTNDYQNLNFFGGTKPLEGGLHPDAPLFTLGLKCKI